jgi:HSP20 family protein
MLDSIKQAGKSIGRELNRAWDNLSEGWRELLSRSSNALTHFARSPEAEARDGVTSAADLAKLPRWSLLAGEVEETDRDLVVRVEVPGMDRDNCRITIDGNLLHIMGEKHFESETRNSTYHIQERAYGAFERTIPLPQDVDIDKVDANYKSGVLTVRLPKVGGRRVRTVPVS